MNWSGGSWRRPLSETTVESVSPYRAWLAVALIAGLLAASIPVLQALNGWPIRSVRVAGEFKELSRDALQSAIADHLTRGFFGVDVEGVRSAALALPWVRDLSVRRVWPDSLHIAVVERTAVASWNGGALMEADGTLFLTDRPTGSSGVPELHGPPGSEEHVLNTLFEIEYVLKGLDDPVVSLSLTARGGWRIELAGGMELVLGRGGDLDRLQQYVQTFPGVFGEGLSMVERIDMRYANGFAVRFRVQGADPVQG